MKYKYYVIRYPDRLAFIQVFNASKPRKTARGKNIVVPMVIQIYLSYLAPTYMPSFVTRQKWWKKHAKNLNARIKKDIIKYALDPRYSLELNL